MPPIVIDASVGLAIILTEPEGPSARAVLRDAVERKTPILVPSHFWLEVANPLLRRLDWSTSGVVRAIHDLDELEVETIELDRAVLLSAIDFAERHRLTSYDAMYLALADAVDGSLMTLDLALRAAAGVRAMPTEPQRRLSEAQAPYEHDVTWPKYKGASAYLAKLRQEALRDAST